MFRFPKINLNDEFKFKAILMKNRREKIGEIPNEFIKTVKRSLNDIDNFEIIIPLWTKSITNKIYNKNPLYYKVHAKQQVLVETIDKNGNTKLERFILREKKRSKGKDAEVKSFKAMSFEDTLKDKRVLIQGKVLQLKSDDVVISDGVLDIFEKQTGWGIGYVDSKSKVENIKAMDLVEVNLFDNYINDKVDENELLWSKDITTNITNETPLYLNITYSNLKAFNGDMELYNDNIQNYITEPLCANITNIKAYHCSVANNRYGIKYVFTLDNGMIEERMCSFMNIIDKKITCDNIKLYWETGSIVDKTVIKFINVESLDDNWYSAINDFVSQFNSVAIYDTYNKLINIIHNDNLGDNSTYGLSYDSNMIKTEIIEEDKYPNALKVIGKDGLSINSVNIFGGDTIYNYDYYIRNGIMSQELQTVWSRYVDLLKDKQEEWEILISSRFLVQQKQTYYKSEVSSLTKRIQTLNDIFSGYVASGDKDNQARLKEEIKVLETRLNECLNKVLTYQKELDVIDDNILVISQSILKEKATDDNGKIFDEIDLEELNDLECVEVYSDEYFSTPYSLIKEAESKLKDMTVPQIDFKIETKNLLRLIQQKSNTVLVLGNLFKIEDDELVSELGDNKIRFVGYEVDVNTKTITNLEFTNKNKKVNSLNKLSNIGKQTSSNSNTIKTMKDVWEESKNSNDFVSTFIKNGLNLAAQTVTGGSSRNFITINEVGILLEDQLNKDRSIFLSSGLICVSKDGFKTSDVAISSDGVVAKTLVGQIVLGSKLIISSELGDFRIGNIEGSQTSAFGLEIKDDAMIRIFLGTKIVNGVKVATLELKGKDGQVVLSDEGILVPNYYQYPDNVSPSYPVKTTFPVDSGVARVKQVKLDLNLDRYRGYTKSIGGGGSVTTTGGSNNITSSEAAPHKHVMFRCDEGIRNDLGGGFEYYCVNYSGNPSSPNGYIDTRLMLPIWIRPSSDGAIPSIYNMYTYTANGNHYHENSHEHSFDFYHIHPIEYGIFEGEIASGCVLKVNGQTVKQNINEDMEIDITSYILLNTKNTIEISSMTNGRIVIGVHSKMFVRH